MICKKCGSMNVNVQMLATTERKRRGCLYWCFGGVIIDLLLWIFLTIPRLLIAFFLPKRTKFKVHTIAVCQNCGRRWNT